MLIMIVRRFLHSFIKSSSLHLEKKEAFERGYPGVSNARDMDHLLSSYRKLADAQMEPENLFLFGSNTSSGNYVVKHSMQCVTYLLERALRVKNNQELRGKRCIVTGLDERSITLARVLIEEQGAVVVGISDSLGMLYDENGLSLDTLKQMNNVLASSMKSSLRLSDFRHAASNTVKYRSIEDVKDNKYLLVKDVNVLFVGEHTGEVSSDDVAAMLEANKNFTAVVEIADRACGENAVRMLESKGMVFIPSRLSGAFPTVSYALDEASSLDRKIFMHNLHDAALLKAQELYPTSSSGFLSTSLRVGATALAMERLFNLPVFSKLN